ncbi:GAF domain-containing protein [Planobispora siamensis]
MRRQRLEAAVPAGSDPRRHARVLAQVYCATLAGQAPPALPRRVIDASWRRVRGYGVDPDRGGGAVPLRYEEVEHRRRDSLIGEVLDTLRHGLAGVAHDASQIMVVTDGEGRVLWREGSSAVRRRADRLGFVEGASWREETVGTNAIGTALAVRRPIQVYSAEHYVRTHHAWTCAAAPVHDPRSGRLIGIADVSGPAATIHPNTLALVDAVARLAEAELRTLHHRDLERLRAVAAPVVARPGGPVLVVDPHGWVAAASGCEPVARLPVPDVVDAGGVWLPSLGTCVMEPLPGGWIVRPDPAGEQPATRVRLDLRSAASPTVTLSGPSGSWHHRLSPRHAEILLLLACRQEGRTATELAGDLFGDPTRTVTVRAEMSRLRRHLGGVLCHRPYRFHDRAEVEVAWPADPADLLPASDAPAVRRLRAVTGQPGTGV